MARWTINPKKGDPFVFDDGPARQEKDGREGRGQRFVKSYLDEAGLEGATFAYAGPSEAAPKPPSPAALADMRAELSELRERVARLETAPAA